QRKSAAFASAAIVFLFATQCVLFGTSVQTPPTVVALLTPSTTFTTMRHLPSMLAKDLVVTRHSFEYARGSTRIVEGTRTRVKRPPRPVVPFAESERDAQAEAIRALLVRFVDGWGRRDADAVLATFDDSDEVEVRTGSGMTIARGRAEVQDFYVTATVSRHDYEIAFTDMRIDPAPDGTATATGQWQMRRDNQLLTGGVGFLLARQAGGWRIVRQISYDAGTPPPADAQVRGSNAATAPPPPNAKRPAYSIAPTHAAAPRSETLTATTRNLRITRFFTGAAALVLPRAIGEALGLFHVGGGRGWMWVTELDTLLFDAALLFAIAVLITNFAAARRDPLVWFILTSTLLIAAPLGYSVTNFGTLFRLREMVLLGVILAPIAASAAARNGDGNAAS
nr:nuclear transport factor 2 family protein [Acidobacteriota bacterium]